MSARIDWQRWGHLVGQVSDNEAATIIGCTAPAVQHYRTRNGVAPAAKVRTKIPRKELHLLGQYPDSVLARRWGVCRERIGQLRRVKGIAACRKTAGELCAELMQMTMEGTIDKVLYEGKSLAGCERDEVKQ